MTLDPIPVLPPTIFIGRKPSANSPSGQEAEVLRRGEEAENVVDGLGGFLGVGMAEVFGI